jgi:heat shock protein HslJ
MNSQPRRRIAHLAVLIVALTTAAGCSLVAPPTVVARAASVPLLDTHWRLAQLGERIIDNPAGARDVHISLSSGNNAVSGNLGCNRMFGHYALENGMLKFDELGATKMYCQEHMALEQAFNNALMATLRWKITGQTLELFDESGKSVATFVASAATG